MHNNSLKRERFQLEFSIGREIYVNFWNTRLKLIFDREPESSAEPETIWK